MPLYQISPGRKSQRECAGWSMLKRCIQIPEDSPLLQILDFDCPFLVQKDASETILGAALSQDGEEHPVIYISHKFMPAEQSSTVLEREVLTIK